VLRCLQKRSRACCGTRQVWDAGSLEGVRAFQTAYTVESASFCAERGRFAAGGDDMWVHLHDFGTGAELEVNKGAPRTPPGLFLQITRAGLQIDLHTLMQMSVTSEYALLLSPTSMT